MHKILAEFLAAFIPQKMTRNRYRGIFRYGLFRALKLKYKLKNYKHPSLAKDVKTPNYLSICAIAKNESEYFTEWIEYHKGKGVEKFYIYDNESADDTQTILKPYISSGLVEYTYWKGKKQQLKVYDHCLDKHRFDSQWIAFIDLEEFIVPLIDKNIPSFLKRFEKFSAIEINWLIFGSSGEKKMRPEPVMERFKSHAPLNHPRNKPVKCIVRPTCVYSFIRCHEVACIYGQVADSHGFPIKKRFREREPQLDVIRINHYAVKSYEEFMKKSKRGSTWTKNRINDEYFKRLDLNHS